MLKRSRRRCTPVHSGTGPIAVLSDIHSNLPALRAVLAECERRQIHRFACLGDIVGYGPYPSECLNVVRSLRCPVVVGNHDHYAAVGPSAADLNSFAAAGLRYSIEHLSSEELDWLAKLPPVHVADGITFVHASLDSPLDWTYILGPDDAEESMSRQETCLGCCGHTHQPGVFTNPGSPAPKSAGRGKLRFSPEGKYLINPGSVGQPRSGDPRAQFAIIDPEAFTVEFAKVKYDVESVYDAVVAAGLPEVLGERLRFGV